MTGLSFARACRAFFAVWLVLSIVLLVQGAAAGNLIGVVASAVGAAGCILVIALMTKVIRMRTGQLRPRPDYDAIARMERDIFGEAFEHDGAPQVSRPQRRTCGDGHPRASAGPCKVCENRYRLEGPIPVDVIRYIARRDWGRDDDAFIRSGAILHPRATVILPSGEKIDSAEWARRGGRTS